MSEVVGTNSQNFSDVRQDMMLQAVLIQLRHAQGIFVLFVAIISTAIFSWMWANDLLQATIMVFNTEATIAERRASERPLGKTNS